MSSDATTPSTPRSAGRPPGATAERTRGEILDAALEAFADSGFEAMSVRRLTRRLGVSHNLVHHHFGSKEELWRAALDHGAGPTARELLGVLAESAGRPDSTGILRGALEQSIGLLTQRPAIVRILADESARPGPRLDFLYQRYLGPLVDILSRFLRESREYGFRTVDSRIAALFVLSAASAQFTHGALASKLGLGDAMQGEYVEAIVDLVLEGLTSRSPASTD